MKEDSAKAVVGAHGVSDRLMELNMLLGESMVSFVVVYAPQAGLSKEEKEVL